MPERSSSVAALVVAAMLLNCPNLPASDSTEEAHKTGIPAKYDLQAAASFLERLTGTWISTENGKQIGECWSRNDSATLEGYGFRITGADTVITERTRIELRPDGVFFIADVRENDSLVRFRLVAQDTDAYCFENSQHDFPQSVCYQPIGIDSLAAWIEGTKNGTTRRIDFVYRRVLAAKKETGHR